MPDPTPPTEDNTPDDVADASLLFDDEPKAAPPPAPKAPDTPVESGDYEIEGSDDPPPPATAPVPPVSRPARPERRAPEARPTAAIPTATVDQVWTRRDEWGSTLGVLAVVGLVVLLLVYLTLNTLPLAFTILVIGGALCLFLSYPIVITLERPVRLTPEQAINDFYNALAHHRPHFRRMWLLLSSAGKTCAEYGSFEGFQSYWKRRLQALRGGRVGSFTPLVFQIQNYKAPKSAGQAATEASYTVVVHARGQQSEPPLATIRVQTSLVRGPDRQWYLNLGTLPDSGPVSGKS